MISKYFKFNKKGSFIDVIQYGIIGAFVIIVTIICCRLLFDQLYNSDMLTIMDSPTASQIMQTQSLYTMPMFDYFFLGIYMSGIIATLILAYLLRSSPLFTPIGILYSAIIVFISAVFSNAYETFISTSQISATASHYPIASFIMLHLPWISLIFCALIMIVMYSIGENQ